MRRPLAAAAPYNPETGDDMKVAVQFWLLVGSLSLAPQLAAQAAGNAPLSEAALYSLYVKRHEMTTAFADLAVARGADGEVRKAAEKLVRAHREARERLERVATDRHLTLVPPEHDTSTVLLEQARTALEGKAGRSFDSTWVSLASSWLSTLILDNNRTVKARIGPALQPIAQEHTTWLFHQYADIDKLRKKFK
jgi:predicted outer membrane protein